MRIKNNNSVQKHLFDIIYLYLFIYIKFYLTIEY